MDYQSSLLGTSSTVHVLTHDALFLRQEYKKKQELVKLSRRHLPSYGSWLMGWSLGTHEIQRLEMESNVGVAHAIYL